MHLFSTLRALRVVALCLVAGGCALVNPPDAPSRRAAPAPVAQPSFDGPLPSLTLHGMESGTLLARLRGGFSLPDPGGSEVRHYERFYAGNGAELEQLAEPGNWYLPYIVDEVARRGLPMELALLPAVESGFDATARSPSGAAGLWQFTAGTARHFGLYSGPWLDQRMNLETSTRAALDYLQDLHRRFRGDWLLALAAYNAGSGKVSRLLDGNVNRGRPATFRFLNLPRETRHFVPKLIALRNVVANPSKYGVTLPDLDDEIRFVRPDSPRQLRHEEVAATCRIEAGLVSQINAGQIRRATPPGGPHRVRVPKDCAGAFDALASVAPAIRATAPRNGRVHVVRPGDSLWRIAREHGLSLAAISHANPGIDADLAPGQRINLPRPAASPASEPLVHRVEAGDTLSALAARYRVSASAIARWNRIALNSTLNLGQVLRIVPD